MLKVKDFISFIEDYPEAEVNFYIYDDDNAEGDKVEGINVGAICTPKECQIIIPYNFLEGRI